jgi:hypothetical protein
MSLFLTIIILVSSNSFKAFSRAPEYETPEIVRPNQLQGNKSFMAMNSEKLVIIKN